MFRRFQKTAGSPHQGAVGTVSPVSLLKGSVCNTFCRVGLPKFSGKQESVVEPGCQVTCNVLNCRLAVPDYFWICLGCMWLNLSLSLFARRTLAIPCGNGI